ncbi:hypothetical protein [Microbispora catharanthi]|uniref:DUF4145 domain-containing protein n=1 Tax=Microbispora catharanthi TaxID=1712871 RepID=A0A5N6BZN4_9ACTN|nr:hypothetical protein [Microbispora catharanthi]KAB8185995.1 hypothetical protein FH610_009580 [Microbispora catharanthi]
MDEFVVLRRDPVTNGMCYGVDDEGSPRRINQTVLQEVIATWPVAPTTPDNILSLLQKSRIAVLCSLAGRELLMDGVLSALHAVEAALRQRIEASGESVSNRHGKPLAWGDLFQRAVSLGLLEREPDDLLDYGRNLRNRLSHPSQVMYLPYAAALRLIETSHRLVARLYATGDNLTAATTR